MPGGDFHRGIQSVDVPEVFCNLPYSLHAQLKNWKFCGDAVSWFLQNTSTETVEWQNYASLEFLFFIAMQMACVQRMPVSITESTCFVLLEN